MTIILFAAAATGRISGQVLVERDGARIDASNVVIFVARTPGQTLPDLEMRQRDLAFTPELLVATVGSTVRFPNDDKVFHNVFSMSQVAKFDLGLYKSGEARTVTFSRAGVVDVFCNIHPQMVAKIKVIDSAYFAVTKSDGAFTLEGVPPGEHTLIAWQMYGAEATRQVQVSDGETRVQAIALVADDKNTRHVRKDGTPYGRYK